MAYTTEEVQRKSDIIRQLTRRWRNHHRRVYIRRLHFYNDPLVDPGRERTLNDGGEYDGDLLESGPLPEGISHIHEQTTAIAQAWEDSKFRITENRYVIGVSDLVEGYDSKDAEDLAETLNSGFRMIEERQGWGTVQEPLADAQAIDSFAWLHWRRHDQIYPEIPEYEYIDALPDPDEEDIDEREKKKRSKERERYEREPGEDGKYKETAKSRAERTRLNRARAGFPYHFEVPDVRHVFSADDEAGEDAVVVHIRQKPVIRYDKDLRERGGAVIRDGTLKKSDMWRVVQPDKNLRLYMEADAPGSDEPSYADWEPDQMVTLATIWTRDKWCEMVSFDTWAPDTLSDGDWQYVMEGRHAFGRPPWAKVRANVFWSSRDPLRRYTPIFENAFRRKPFYDRYMSIAKGMAEKGLPHLILQNTGRGPSMPDESGREQLLKPDSNAADELPPGWEVVKIHAELTSSYMRLLEIEREQFDEAIADTGNADISATTKPHTARAAIQQADKGPKYWISQQAYGIEECARSIARDMSTPVEEGGFGETVWVFKHGPDGQRTQQIVGIEPDRIRSLDIHCTINPVSSVEQLTIEVHGMEQVGAGFLTKRDWLENYKSVEDPTEELAKLYADQFIEQFVNPGWMQQKVAEIWGTQFRVGVNGNILDSQGTAMAPDQMLAKKGITPRMREGGGMANEANVLPATMGPLRDDSPPAGVLPQRPAEGM